MSRGSKVVGCKKRWFAGTPPAARCTLTLAPETLAEPISIILDVLESYESAFVDFLVFWSFPRQHCWLSSRFVPKSVICLCGYRVRRWTSRPRMIFLLPPFWRQMSGAFFPLSNSRIGHREPFHRATNWWGHEQKTRFWFTWLLVGWLSSSEVHFLTSHDFSFYTVLKMSVRRVFCATKLPNRVPGTLSTNHELKRS